VPDSEPEDDADDLDDESAKDPYLVEDVTDEMLNLIIGGSKKKLHQSMVRTDWMEFKPSYGWPEHHSRTAIGWSFNMDPTQVRDWIHESSGKVLIRVASASVWPVRALPLAETLLAKVLGHDNHRIATPLKNAKGGTGSYAMVYNLTRPEVKRLLDLGTVTNGVKCTLFVRPCQVRIPKLLAKVCGVKDPKALPQEVRDLVAHHITHTIGKKEWKIKLADGDEVDCLFAAVKGMTAVKQSGLDPGYNLLFADRVCNKPGTFEKVKAILIQREIRNSKLGVLSIREPTMCTLCGGAGHSHEKCPWTVELGDKGWKAYSQAARPTKKERTKSKPKGNPTPEAKPGPAPAPPLPAPEAGPPDTTEATAKAPQPKQPAITVTSGTKRKAERKGKEDSKKRKLA